ncbi:MAG: hypothetical protein IT449_17045 [Phycisphaerales bacterium]|nr:hypothetical protein [Phycisphaerales bacterium]
MTKTAVRKAFDRLDTADQMEFLGEIATRMAEVLVSWDQIDAAVFHARRHEERAASPISTVRRRLLKKRSE